MTLVESLPIVSDKTASFLSRVEDDDLPDLSAKEYLGETNQEIAEQTQPICTNGTSNMLDGKSSEMFSLYPPLDLMRPRLEYFTSLTREQFRVLQKWEGYVIKVRRDTFLAKLVPIVGGGPDQEAEIYLEEVKKQDRALIEPGAVFYWSIGYLDKPSGRHRTSLIRFRRLPRWTRHELEIADAEATRLRDIFDVE